MSLRIQVTNGIQSIKEGDTLTDIKMLLIEGNGTIYDLAGKTAKFVLSSKAGKLLEKPVVETDKQGEVVFSFAEGEVTGAGQMFLEVHVTDGPNTKIFPSSDYLVVSVDKNLNIIGQTITSIQFENLKSDISQELGFEIQEVNTRIDELVTEISEDLSLNIIDTAKINWVSPVAEFTSFATVYPSPQIGYTAQTLDDNKIYRFNGTSWVFIQQFGSGPFTDVYKKLNEQKYFVNVKEFGAVGNGVSDDSNSLQNAFNYAFDNGFGVHIPAGTFLVTRPIMVYGYTEGYSQKSTHIRGSGRGTTRIIKNNNTTVNIADNSPAPFNQHSQNIDAIFVVATEFARNNVPITDPWSTQSIARKVTISELTLESTSTIKVNSGIYSLGYFFSNFYEIDFINTNKAMVTTRYNCYSNFFNLEAKVKGTGFEFLTPIGGNTTMLFQNVHLDGVDGIGFNIKGGCTFINCPIDGGLATVFKFTQAMVKMIATHFESPTIACLINADDSSSVYVDGGDMEISRVAGSISFKATNKSIIKIANAKHYIANRGGSFPATSPGKMIEADKTSRVILSDTFVSDDAFDIKTYYSTPISDKYVVIDGKRLDTPFNKYIYYVGGAVPVNQYATTTITQDATNGQLVVDRTVGEASYAVVFRDAIDFSNYSRLYMRANLDFDGSNSIGNNQFKFSLNVQNVLKSDGFVSQGVSIPSVREENFFYDATNQKYYIDISDLFGKYYVELRVNGQTNAQVKEIALLK